jgi:uncharacterized protein YceK|tara:strand:+ start:50 stop:190 length:141 start_codon:yes stop_codon:yes gene_type:complete
MIKKLTLVFVVLVLSGCASIKEKMPKRSACTGNETGKTLSEVLCKK